MSLRASISSHTRALQRPLPPMGTPKTVEATRELLRRLSAVHPRGARRPVSDPRLSALARRFQAACARNRWDDIGEADWNGAWEILWRAQPEEGPPLLSQSRFQLHYRHWLQDARTGQPFKQLIYAYLSEFDPAREGLDWAAKLLRKTILQQIYPDLEFWRENDFKYELFSPELGPRRIAQAILQGNAMPLTFLDGIGFHEDLSTGGLARAAHREIGERLAAAGTKAAASPEQAAALAAWGEEIAQRVGTNIASPIPE